MGCHATAPALVARFNKKSFDPRGSEPGTVDYDLPGDSVFAAKWTVPKDDSADIAYVQLDAKKLESLGANLTVFPLSFFPKQEELEKINTGAQIVSAGLIAGASGRRRNYPIFKFGHVSSHPGEKMPAPLCCPTCSERELTQWMTAASLVPGNSGSPILFSPVGFSGIGFGGPRAALLGVQSTSFVG